MTRPTLLTVLAFLGCSLAVPARGAGPARAPEPGVWWEVTSEMTVHGANVPPQARRHTQTSRECLPKKVPDRPPPVTGDCAVSEFKRSGPRLSFRLSCPEGVTGEAELLWTSDTYSGTTTMRGQGMENRITMKGKKLGGDCDAGAELDKEEATHDAAQDEARQLRCADAATGGDLAAFVPAEAGAAAECADATRYCAALETRRGLSQLRQSGLEDGPRQAGALCKKDVAAIEKRLCAALAKEPEQKVTADVEASEFLFASCPDLAKGMAKRACAGRSFTGMPWAKREFCTRWAQEALQGR